MRKGLIATRALWLTAALAVGLGAGCGGNNDSAISNPYAPGAMSAKKREEIVTQATKALEEAPAKAVTAGMNDFGFNLLRQLPAEDAKNVCISPLSISLALGMTMTGAEGGTREAMAKSLGVGTLPALQVTDANKNLMMMLTSIDPQVQLQIANSIWIRDGLKVDAKFLQTNQQSFNAKVENLDFTNPSSVKTINDWVRENTGGKIPTIIEEIPDEAAMYLVNAVYFLGKWEKPFERDMTKEQDFHLADGSKIAVPMMNGYGKYGHLKNEELEAVSLKYGKGRLAMAVVLPGKNLEDTLKTMDQKAWAMLLGNLHETDGSVALPKFKLEYETALKDPLTALGMGVIFDPNAADFSGIRREKDLYVTQVKHKTFIEVNEEGTEAAAATGVEVGVTSAPAEPFKFVADRPFLYAIYDRQTQAILFVGVVRNPEAQG